ncbi:MAG: sulfite exporter TauE/SafE family protein [Geminocystis sp.]|nr:sulfite exporter TauE/SafE family protein [Geminocystis sp.]HIK37259.1 sulfite exporter TauE/SafE family protein [Geminocystis sp. M7585_C2015_104]MCS7148216.1 sulfite exporter TauE/SafE family protein [Geminocystis sp.]MCX8077630.1 sulfite exporter TauE/SafE family protein [Geminocystis sp.]MDW8117320.1 sulfite exporter TauE/SafE family protein [Geminocystis sp.]
MTFIQLIILVTIFFITAFVGVVTGSNSLITVPVMLQFGIEPAVAIATNMFGLIFLSIGGVIPFLKTGFMRRKDIPLLTTLTLFGSLLGAILVLIVPPKQFPFLISLFLIAITVFSIFNSSGKNHKTYPKTVSAVSKNIAYLLTFLLGIYGGFYSGGYVTTLTACYVGFLGMTFVEAVAVTKLLNVFSSLIATVVFMVKGLIDYPLAIVLSITMFCGAYLGGKFAIKMNEIFLKKLFITVVIALAIKTFWQWLSSGGGM